MIRRRDGFVTLESPSDRFSPSEQALIREKALANIAVGEGRWEWQGATDRGGYGRIRVRRGTWRRDVAVHRVVYDLVRGRIRRGRMLDHLCSQWACVRPSHLEPVTVGQKIARMLERERNGWRCVEVAPGTWKWMVPSATSSLCDRLPLRAYGLASRQDDEAQCG